MSYEYEVRYAKGFLAWCILNRLGTSTIETAQTTLEYWREKQKKSEEK